jgi:hypothetical protein
MSNAGQQHWQHARQYRPMVELPHVVVIMEEV